MWIKSKIPDYKLSSTKIYKGTMLAFFAMVFLILVAEIFIDIRATTPEVMGTFAVLTSITTLLGFRFPESQVLRTFQIILVYALVEVHFLANPTIFHSILYWFPFVPIMALIINGLRASQLWLAVVLLTHGANYIVLRQTVSDIYTTPVIGMATFVVGYFFITGILATSYLLYNLLGDAYAKVKRGNLDLDSLKTKIEAKKELLVKYQQTLIFLSKDASVINRGKRELFRGVCSTAVNALQVNRVSIWMLEDENTKLVRKFLFEKDHESDETVILERNNYPAYFHAVEYKPYILATNAKDHPETIEFKEGYLTPLDIYSMLDCPIVIDRIPVGVICCENQHAAREWDTEDALFIQSLADFIAISYKNERIRNLLEEVKQQNYELVDKSNEIGAMNEELHSLNETLATMNNSLEETVKARTFELETQNKQLTEYAFINSHLLRAPLTRILGLSSLITREVTTFKEAELINALIASTNELDSIIRKISDILYDGNNLSREDIQAIVDRRLNKNA